MFCHGVSVKGASHEKDNIVCQDAYAVVSQGTDKAIAAVADGLGSAEHSDVASRLAVDVVTSYCAEHIVQIGTPDDILQIIKASFSEALDAIENKAKTQGHNIEQYHTTLSLVVLFEGTLYYGHSGDSGIIALTTKGLYEKVVEQQQNEKGQVFPLFRKHRWEFGQFNEKVCSVLLATDGMLSALAPPLLKNEPVKIWVSLAGYFMDNRSLRFRIREMGENAVRAEIDDCVRKILPQGVNYDDKTILILVRMSIEPESQPNDYYNEPNWEELKRKRAEEWKQQWESSDDKIEKNTDDTLPSRKSNDTYTDSNAETKPSEKSETYTAKDTVHEPEVKPPKKKDFIKWLFGK